MASDIRCSVQLSLLCGPSDVPTPKLAFLTIPKNLSRVTCLPYPLPWEESTDCCPSAAQHSQTIASRIRLHVGKGMLLTTEQSAIQTYPGGFFFNVSDIRVFMNLGQHSEAAAKRSWNELPVLANLFFALFILLEPSATCDMADPEALLIGQQNPTILTSSNTCLPVVGEAF